MNWTEFISSVQSLCHLLNHSLSIVDNNQELDAAAGTTVHNSVTMYDIMHKTLIHMQIYT